MFATLVRDAPLVWRAGEHLGNFPGDGRSNGA